MARSRGTLLDPLEEETTYSKTKRSHSLRSTGGGWVGGGEEGVLSASLQGI